jgi:hypothetical protein
MPRSGYKRWAFLKATGSVARTRTPCWISCREISNAGASRRSSVFALKAKPSRELSSPSRSLIHAGGYSRPRSAGYSLPPALPGQSACSSHTLWKSPPAPPCLFQNNYHPSRCQPVKSVGRCVNPIRSRVRSERHPHLLFQQGAQFHSYN